MDHEHGAQQLERLTFFSDAVFAIAMTLLVIDVRLPPAEHLTNAELNRALLRLIPSYLGFVVSFMVIGLFWRAHHRVFGLLTHTNERLLAINMYVLLTVAFMPFPTAVLSEWGELHAAMPLYGAWLMVMGIAQHALMRVALRRPGLVREDVPDAECRYLLRGSQTPIATGILTIATALISPWVGAAFLVFGSPVVHRLFHRKHGGQA